MNALIAQTTTTIAEETPSIEVVEPSRPFSGFLIDLFNLEPESFPARLLETVLEPLIQIVLILVIALVAVRLLNRATRHMVERAKTAPSVSLGSIERSFGDEGAKPMSTRRAQRTEAIGAVLDSVIAVTVWAIALLTILGTTFGISLAPLLAGAGILGVALGFGAQDLVKDFLSGMFMLLEDQYGVGDVVDVGEANGIVESISLRTTSLRDVTGTLWHVPNGEIRRVGNMSQEWSRALLDVGVAYDTDIDAAAAVIKRVADEMAAEEAYSSLFLADPEVWGVEELSADSIVLRLVVKTQPGEQMAICRELRRRIKFALDAAQIEIPFPQRTVWFRSDDTTDGDVPEDPAARSDAAGKGAPEEGASVTADDHPEKVDPVTET